MPVHPRKKSAIIATAGVSQLFIAAISLALAFKTGGPKAKPQRVRLSDMVEAFEKDFVTAESQYGGKELEFEAKGQIEKGVGENYVAGCAPERVVRSHQGARFMSPERFHVATQEAALNAEYLPGVILRVKKADLQGFKGLNPSKSLTVQGKFLGATRDPKTFPEFVLT